MKVPSIIDSLYSVTKDNAVVSVVYSHFKKPYLIIEQLDSEDKMHTINSEGETDAITLTLAYFEKKDNLYFNEKNELQNFVCKNEQEYCQAKVFLTQQKNANSHSVENYFRQLEMSVLPLSSSKHEATDTVSVSIPQAKTAFAKSSSWEAPSQSAIRLVETLQIESLSEDFNYLLPRGDSKRVDAKTPAQWIETHLELAGIAIPPEGDPTYLATSVGGWWPSLFTTKAKCFSTFDLLLNQEKTDAAIAEELSILLSRNADEDINSRLQFNSIWSPCQRLYAGRKVDWWTGLTGYPANHSQEVVTPAIGMTPLMLACQRGLLATIQVLLDHKADYKKIHLAEDETQRTAMDFAIENKHSAAIKLLYYLDAPYCFSLNRLAPSISSNTVGSSV